MLQTSTQRNPSLDGQRGILGVSIADITPAANLVISTLLENLGDTQAELARARATLAEMERLVDEDCLAAVPNRRAFESRLAWTISMHERYSYPSSILYFDLNGFKAINDTMGHAAGDAVIKHVGRVFTDELRGSDYLARIGGDEFAIILYYCDEASAEKRGRELAEKIHRSPLSMEGRSVYIATSVGAYGLRPGDTVHSAMAGADMAMYLHKKTSRQVVA